MSQIGIADPLKNKFSKFDLNKNSVDKRKPPMSKLELSTKKNDYSNSKNIRRLYNDFLQKTVDNSN